MKKLMRSNGVQAFLGWVLGTYLKLILRTVRWRHENLACVEPVLADDTRGAIALFWHGRIPLCLATAPQWWKKRTRCLISPSADGEFIARALEMSGFPAIRVSSAKKGDAAKARAAVAAIREATAWVKGGGALVVTPDGPRGPNEVIAAGSLQIARRSGQPVYLMGIAASPATQMQSTWDKVMWAAPFGRGAVVWEGPLHVPADADETAIAALIEDWSARLSSATRRAEALVGRRPH
ncbi:MAG: lysophospholipid acyltransferase family protein [Pseudomonadota bacterium]